MYLYLSFSLSYPDHVSLSFLSFSLLLFLIIITIVIYILILRLIPHFSVFLINHNKLVDEKIKYD